MGTIKKGNSTMALAQFKNQSCENGVKDLYLEILFGAGGTISSFVRQFGFTRTPAALVRTGTGLYTVNFDQKWQAVVEYDFNVISASVAGGEALQSYINGRNLTAAQPNLTLTFVAANATSAADPTTGATILLHFGLKDSTV